MEFKHFILTRLNLNFRDQPYEQAISVDWMVDRMRIFSKYGIPSIKNQTNEKFTWLLLIDENTRPRFRKEITEVLKGVSNVVVKDCAGKKQVAFAQEFVQADEYVVTTRVDSDDILPVDFVDTIQKELRPVEDKEILNFPYGFVYPEADTKGIAVLKSLCLDTRGMIVTKQASNPFITLVEKVGASDIITAWQDAHLKMGEYAPIRQIGRNKPYWIQVVHENNLYNQHNLRPHRLLLHLWYSRKISFDEQRFPGYEQI